MITFLTRYDYTVIATAPDGCDDAPDVCRRLEEERDDGFGVAAYQEDKLIADAEGWYDRGDA